MRPRQRTLRPGPDSQPPLRDDRPAIVLEPPPGPPAAAPRGVRSPSRTQSSRIAHPCARPSLDTDDSKFGCRGEFHAVKKTQNRIRIYGDTHLLDKPGTSLANQEDADAGQQALQPFRPATMGTDQSGEAFRKHARATGTIGTTKSAQQQLNVDRPAVRGRVHQQTDIVAVLATGDTTAQGTRRTGPHALGGDGNVCRRRFLLPERQTDTSQKPLQIARTPRQAAAKEVRGFRINSSNVHASLVYRIPREITNLSPEKRRFLFQPSYKCREIGDQRDSPHSKYIRFPHPKDFGRV